MKTQILFLALMFLTLISFSKTEKTNNDYIFSYTNNKGKEQKIGFYTGVYGSYSEVQNKPAGYLGYKIGAVINEKFAIGLAGYGLAFDEHFQYHETNELYHLESAYAGMYIEYIQSLGNKFKIHASLFTGQGLAQFKFNNEFRESKAWYKEIIDLDTYGVFEPGAEISYKMGSKWWIGAHASYRSTSPILLDGVKNCILEGMNYGLSVKWGIF